MAYQPALDGLRAVSVLLVFLMHCSYGKVPGGWLGVNIFFVLSGYLITALLIEEWSRSHAISVRAFYARRALRLLPALLATVALTAVTWRLYRYSYAFAPAALASVFYYANWVAAFDPYLLGDFGHLWSLSVEEQFYLVWPLVMLGLLSRCGATARLAYALVGMAVAAVALRPVLYRIYPPLGGYTSTFSRADALLLGASLAALLRTRAFAAWAGSAGGRWIGYSCFALTLACAGWVGIDSPALYSYSLLSLLSLANTLTLANLVADDGSTLARVLSAGPLVWLGRRSYGIYLYHFTLVPTLEPLRRPHDYVNFLWVSLARLLVVIAVAEISYRFVERPFLRWKQRFAFLRHGNEEGDVKTLTRQGLGGA